MVGRTKGARMAQSPQVVRRDYKDSLFCDIFGKEERKAYALELYNALGRGVTCADPSELDLTTLENVLYLGRKNDVSYIIQTDMELWEQQSTYNPNMPIRGLGYLSRLYDNYINRNKFDIFHGPRLALPTPHYVVFYNGFDERPDREEQLLSSLFAGGDGDLELRVTALNINWGRNTELMDACEPLGAYARFVHHVREYDMKNNNLKKAVDYAIDRCIAEGRLADYFRERRMEVEEMFILGDDQEKAMQYAMENFKRQGLDAGRKEGLELGRDEGRKEGLKLGRDEGRKEGLKEGFKEGSEEATLSIVRDLVRDHILTVEEASERYGISQSKLLSS